MSGGRFSLGLWQKALAQWREKRWDKHRSRVATSRWGEKSRAARGTHSQQPRTPARSTEGAV